MNLSWKSEKDGLNLQEGYSNWKPAKGGPCKEDYCIEKKEGFSDSKCLQGVRFIENDWSSEKEVGKSFSFWSKCSLDRHLCKPFTV